MFELPAYAQDAAGAAATGPGLAMQILPLVLIFVVFYFLLIRPQQKRMKEHKEMIDGLRRGDIVVTAGGLIGKITRVADDEVTVEVADNVRVRVVKSTIGVKRSSTEPAPANDSEAA